MMKNTIILFICLIFISSCGDESVLKKVAAQSTKLVISGYYAVGEKRNKDVVFETDKKDEINKILAYIGH